MGKPFAMFGVALLMLGGVFCLPACSPRNPETVSLAVLGEYEFGGEKYEILSARCIDDGSYVMFSFSPLAPSEPMTTYAVFGIRDYWLGKETDVADVDHNDDYIFVYEDPLRFYSQYRRPLDGSFFVSHNDGCNYTVKVELTLPDGTPFSVDFTGDFDDGQI